MCEDLNNIIALIDAEILKRKSDKFGIKVGGVLYKALADKDLIKKVEFSLWGSGLFAEELPAYKGKHYIFSDWEMDECAFAVGVPEGEKIS